MFFFGAKKPPHQSGCLAWHIVTAFLLLLATLASFIGMVMAHYDSLRGMLVFGTPAASLSLMAFAFTLSLFMYQCKTCFAACDVCAAMGKKK